MELGKLKGVKVLSKQQQLNVNGGDIIDSIAEWCKYGYAGGSSLLRWAICPDEDEN